MSGGRLTMKIQSRITLPWEVRQDIDRLRETWNPERATGNPTHITVVYHDEAPDISVLTERLHAATARTAPFRLTVGTLNAFPPPVVGAYLSVIDEYNSVAMIRDLVLERPFTPRDRYGLHITLLHPDQGTRLETAWPAFESLPAVGSFIVTELQLVGPDQSVMMTFPLMGDQPNA
jgi:2'-5' RNA ligase